MADRLVRVSLCNAAWRSAGVCVEVLAVCSMRAFSRVTLPGGSLQLKLSFERLLPTKFAKNFFCLREQCLNLARKRAAEGLFY